MNTTHNLGMNSKGKSLIPQYNPNKINVSTKPYINKNTALMYGWLQEGNTANIFVSIRFVQHDYQCFSSWSKSEMTSFWEFLTKIHDYTWVMFLGQSGKQEKSGFGYTVLPVDKYPKRFTEQIDPTVTFFELRITDKARVHCFRDKSICYICWLDRNHTICS